MRSISRLLYITLISLATIARANDFDVGQALLDGFGAECPSYGEFTKNAFRDTQKLETIILSLRSDSSECSAIADKLQKAKDYESLLKKILETDSHNRQIQGLSSQIQDLTSNYFSTSDPDLKSATLSQLVDSNIQLSLLKGNTPSVKQTQFIEGLDLLMGSAQSVSNLLISENKCFQKRPEMGLKVAGELLSASAVIISASAGTVYGAAALVAGAVIAQSAKAIREAHFAKLLKKTRSTKLITGIGCALEATARQYCKANDLKLLADTIANGVRLENTNHSNWTALRLIQQDDTLYNEFIRRVVSGVPAQTKSQTVDRKAILNLEHEIAIDREDFDAILGEASRQEAVADPGQLSGIRISAIKDLLTVFYFNSSYRTPGSNFSFPENVGMPNFYGDVPFSLIFGFDVACGIRNYLYTGTYATSQLVNGFCPVFQTQPTVATLTSRVHEILERTEEAVADQKNQTMSSYSLQILSQCNVGRGSQLTPCNYLKDVKTYLDRLSHSGRSIPEYTFKQITELLGNVSKAEITLQETTRGDPAKVLTTVQTLLAPRNDTQYLNSALKVILEWDLQDLRNNHKIVVDLSILMAASREASITLLSQLGVENQNMELIKAQTAAIQDNSIAQMKSLTDLFFKSYVKTEKQMKRTSDAKAEVCAQWIAGYPFLSERRKHRLKSVCAGSELVSIYQNRETRPSINFDRAILNTQAQAISCDLFNYRRANDILKNR